MNALILYATYSGGTLEASQQVEEMLSQAKHTVVLKRANEVSPEDLTRADFIVFGSCTWDLFTPHGQFQGQLHQDFIDFTKTFHGHTFPGKRFAVFGLGDRRYIKFCAAADHLAALVHELKGTLIGEPLKIDGYFFRLEENRRAIEAWTNEILRQLTS